MTVNAKPTGRASSMPAGLAAGGLTSLAVTLAGTAVLAVLVDREILEQGRVGYGIMVLVLLAAWLGAKCAWGKIKRRRALVCALAGAVYYATLLSITALFFGGQYSGAGETALLVLCGSVLAILRLFPPRSGAKRRKFKIPTG